MTPFARQLTRNSCNQANSNIGRHISCRNFPTWPQRGGRLPNNSPPAKSKRRTTMSEKSKRGFASMDQQKQREIARKGGRAAHAKGAPHAVTPEEARAAGPKGGAGGGPKRVHLG